MEHNLSNIQLYAYACLIFIITGVVCGIVRWNHMCRPFNENGDFHYPARRLVSFFYIVIALEFPYVLSPMTPDYWTYVKIFGIIFYPVCMTTLFSSYFFRKRLRDSILLKTYLFSAFALLLSLLAIALTMGGHVLTDAGTPLMAAMGGFSLLFSTLSVHITNQLKRTIDKFNTDNYSNVKDFPYRFAQLELYLPLCWIALMWAVFVSDSRWCKLAVDLITSAAMIYMLCIILHPQQLFTNKQEPDPANDGSKDTATTDSPSEIDAIGNEVLSIILRRYREPHLQKSEVLSEIPKGKVNAASKYINPTGILQPREHVPPAARRPLQGGASGGKTGGNCRRVGILVAHGVLQGAQKRGGNRRQNREVCETLNPLYRHDFRTFSRTLATEVAR